MADGTLRWGLIGTGTVAQQWMIDAINAQAGSQVTSVFDINRDRGEEVAQKWPGIGVAESSDALIADENLDAVYICTTNETHAPLTLQAAAAGKHVLCEKPMAMNLDDARTMIAACKDAGVVLGINHHLRHAATHGAIRQAIKLTFFKQKFEFVGFIKKVFPELNLKIRDSLINLPHTRFLLNIQRCSGLNKPFVVILQ